ncbi:MAG: thioredoxin domain-containing protein [Roseiarcus sp.]
MKAGKYALSLLAILSLAPLPARAEEGMSRESIEAIVAAYIKAHPDEIGALVKDYVVRHPEVLREILVELSRQKAASQNDVAAKADALAGERAQKIAAHAQDLFNSPRQVTLGDPGGDVTLVEFFDYNCGYCRRALADTVMLLGADAHVRLVLKEFPILGPRSVDAAQVAVAARMQDPGGDRYFAFHRRLLGSREPVTQDAALAAARESGFDMERLQRAPSASTRSRRKSRCCARSARKRNRVRDRRRPPSRDSRLRQRGEPAVAVAGLACGAADRRVVPSRRLPPRARAGSRRAPIPRHSASAVSGSASPVADSSRRERSADVCKAEN